MSRLVEQIFYGGYFLLLEQKKEMAISLICDHLYFAISLFTIQSMYSIQINLFDAFRLIQFLLCDSFNSLDQINSKQLLKFDSFITIYSTAFDQYVHLMDSFSKISWLWFPWHNLSRTSWMYNAIIIVKRTFWISRLNMLHLFFILSQRAHQANY